MPYLDLNKHWREQEELANAPTLGNLHPDARRQAIARASITDAKALAEQLTAQRLAWLHSTAATDAEGYEYGIFRVKWQDGRAADVQRTRTDGSDLPALTGAQPAPPSSETAGIEGFVSEGRVGRVLKKFRAAQPADSAMTDEQIEQIAHRKAWHYSHNSSNPNDSANSEYTFNRATLLEFARALTAASKERSKP